MDFFYQANAQVRDVFRQMTPSTRLTSGLLFAVVVVSIALLFRFSWQEGRSALLGGRVFSADELKAAAAAFGATGLSDFEPKDGNILVPERKKDLYLAALADARALPPDFDSWITEFLENDSPFSSMQQQTARARMFKEKRLALIIRNMRGIETASVHFDEDKKGPFHSDKDSTAAVAVKPIGNQRLEPDQVDSLRVLVAACEAGLAPGHVTVTDLNAGRSYGGEGDDWSPSRSDPYFRQQQRYEQELTRKIYEILSYIPDLRVATSVRLNPQMETHNSIIKYDNAQSGITRRESTKTVEHYHGRDAVGRNGFEQNARLNQGGTIPSSSQDGITTDNRVELRESLPSSERITKTSAGLIPERVKVSVGVPRSYYQKVWEQNKRSIGQAVPPIPDVTEIERIEEQENENIKKSIQTTLLATRESSMDPFSDIVVVAFQDIPLPTPERPDFFDEATTWLGQNWATLGMMGLALASLGILRGMVRFASPDPTPPINATPELSVVPRDERESEEAHARSDVNRQTHRRFKAEDDLQDELVGLIREDPDSAAAILRGWLSEAS